MRPRDDLEGATPDGEMPARGVSRGCPSCCQGDEAVRGSTTTLGGPAEVRHRDHSTKARAVGKVIAPRRQKDRPLAQGSRALSERKTAEIIRTLALALHAAHTWAVAHCDIKPGNIFGCGEVIEPARLKIGDFGLSRFVPADGDACVVAHNTGGTVGYMAPEQYIVDPENWTTG